MKNQLPEVDDLIKLAQEDPQALEQLRKHLCAQLIENAPKHYQRRLNGLQFQIDMTRRKSGNGLHSCIKISEMMLESYQGLQSALSGLTQEIDPLQLDSPSQQNNSEPAHADIIDFRIATQKH